MQDIRVKVKNEISIVALPIGKLIGHFRQLIASIFSGFSGELISAIISMFVDGGGHSILDVD